MFPPKDSSNQINTYKIITEPIINNVLAGYNSTVMAYGQTGTGKTHTIVNEVLPQVMQYLQNEKIMSHLSVRLSCLQIYNDSLSDLLQPKNILKIREKQSKFHVEGLHEEKIQSFENALEVIKLSEMHRKIGETSMNIFSSRSHAIYRFVIENFQSNTVSVLHLVDLAGSERLNKSKICNERYDETISINSSLTTLGKCIISLSGKKSNHVPFRESKLTKVLQDSFGGNSKTVLVITLSPEIADIEETIASLNFGQRACLIKNMPLLNFQEPKIIDESYKLEFEEKILKINELEYENLDLMNKING